MAIILPQPDTTQPVLVARTEEKFILFESVFRVVYIISVYLVVILSTRPSRQTSAHSILSLTVWKAVVFVLRKKCLDQ